MALVQSIKRKRGLGIGDWGLLCKYCSVKARDAMNCRQDKKLIIVETAIYRVFVMIYRVFAI
ncbi:MAG: hypothetical protein V7L11_11930 [Nostoc sp.]|uniref:hypothetical protein n=1 Tax=Nostoc sp. TaxID=1180 RepID=UPI002FF91519